PPVSPCAADTPLVVMERPVLHEGQLVARVRVSFDAGEADRQVAGRRLVLSGLVGLQLLFGVIVLVLVLANRLLRPIDRLQQQAGTLARRDQSPALSWPRRDELGLLGEHLNQVRTQIHELIGELESKNSQLNKMAMFDHLTGLPNRTLLHEVFTHEAAAARRAGTSLALLFIDLDRFKTVNDTLGHAAGDELLVGISRRLVATLRESDVVCRMGGDEFIVLLPDPGQWSHVAGTADRLLRAIEEPLLLSQAGQMAQVSASMGIAMFPSDGADFDALSRTADLAMYRSKDLGRARYCFYHPDLDTAFRTRLELERELVRAIAENELVLHYQPQVDASSRRVVGCEALVRWQHPHRGLLMPSAFIETAEQTGLIRDLGQWTLEAACAQFAAWRDAGVGVGRIAVNVSALQAHDPQLPVAVRASLERHRMQPHELEIELTESTLLSDTEGAVRTVERLRELGTVLAIDDFGTGYSSLSYLKLLRPDKLKIDRSFVRDLPDDADDRSLTEAIVGIAHALDITVVAEGVEQEAQRDYLLGLGCRLQQGFLYGRPMSAAAFAAAVRDGPSVTLSEPISV
ncbi:MAG TPA: EAL domain-containing protein, partial [Rubrivivax sp.]|nr:EAL domain-containing protein [Rubrivivax sp.]